MAPQLFSGSRSPAAHLTLPSKGRSLQGPRALRQGARCDEPLAPPRQAAGSGEHTCPHPSRRTTNFRQGRTEG